MAKEYEIGKMAGLSLRIEPAFYIGTIILWVALGLISFWTLGLSVFQAVLWGLVATVLYWISDIIHHLGHAYAARRTGHPMMGILLGTYLILGTSLYPEDEGELPGAVHIRRALGGPIASLIFSIAAGILAILLFPAGAVAWRMAMFICLINLFLFSLGAFMPLGFTDGSTLLKWRGER